MKNLANREHERGIVLLVVVFIAMAIAGLAALSSGRVVSETKMQRVLEDEARAYNGAYSQLHMAMNVVNSSAYNDENQNIALRDALGGFFGGTVAGGTAQEQSEELIFYYGAGGKAGGAEYARTKLGRESARGSITFSWSARISSAGVNTARCWNGQMSMGNSTGRRERISSAPSRTASTFYSTSTCRELASSGAPYPRR